MEEKRQYVVYVANMYHDELERVVKMTETQAKAIKWFINAFAIDGCIALAENYEAEEI
jgi:hypothetical protein